MKRHLKRIRLDKIAAVDLPCQEHATVAIIKRAPTPLALAKASFQEALDAAQMTSAVNRAFYDSFDGLWERNDAFREALTDELTNGGDGSVASAAYVASVQALVAEAVSSARKAGIDEAGDADADKVQKVLNESAERWLAKKSSPKENVMNIKDKAALKAAIKEFDADKSPASHVAIITKAARDLGAEDELPSDGPLAKAAPDPALVTAQREIAILKLAPEAKTYFDTLDESGQTAFLGKSAADQAADIEKATGDDPVVYTTTDGTPIRKSDGATVLALAKNNDKLAKDLADAKGEGQTARLEKRAATEFPNVAQATAVTMLKSAEREGLESPAGQDVLKSLKTMNDTQSGVFKRVGSDAPAEPGEGVVKARSTFAGKVEEIKKRDRVASGIAMSKARVEFPDLYAEAYPAPADADAE